MSSMITSSRWKSTKSLRMVTIIRQNLLWVCRNRLLRRVAAKRLLNSKALKQWWKRTKPTIRRFSKTSSGESKVRVIFMGGRQKEVQESHRLPLLRRLSTSSKTLCHITLAETTAIGITPLLIYRWVRPKDRLTMSRGRTFGWLKHRYLRGINNYLIGMSRHMRGTSIKSWILWSRSTLSISKDIRRPLSQTEREVNNLFPCDPKASLMDKMMSPIFRLLCKITYNFPN